MSTRHVSASAKLESPENFDTEASAGLFVGVGEFEDHYPEVAFAVDDAIDLAHLFCIYLRLADPGNSVLCLSGEPLKPITQDRLKELQDGGVATHNARQVDIYRQLYRVASATNEEGLLLVAIASHGLTLDDRGGIILASDTLTRWQHRTAVVLGDLRSEMQEAPAKRSLVLIDACREYVFQGARGVASEGPGKLSSEFVKAMEGAEGMAVIFGAPVGGYSFDDEESSNGVFSAAIIDGLQGKAPCDNRGFITVGTMRRYVDGRIRTWASKRYSTSNAPSSGISVEGDEEALNSMPLSSIRTIDTTRESGLRSLEKKIGIHLCAVPKGSFEMGSPPTETGRGEDEAQHRVKLSRGFRISETPVTQEQFSVFVADTSYRTTAERSGGSWALNNGMWLNRSGLTWRDSGGPKHPVVHISWADVCAFCQWLTEVARSEVRLPTEAEWEYSARAGRVDKVTDGRADSQSEPDLEVLKAVAWFDVNSQGRAHPVGEKARNDWGIFDMLGNVWEWVADAVDRTSTGLVSSVYRANIADPRGDEGSERALRGGSFFSPAEECRFAKRHSGKPERTMQHIGFRIVFS